MDGSVLLDVTIGLVLMYLLIALFCTAFQEWAAQLLQLRANHLQAAVTALLSGGNTTPSPEATAVLDHPLFKLLAKTPAGKPAYVTSENFANALISKLVPAGDLTIASLKAGIAGVVNNQGLTDTLNAIVRQAEAIHPVAKAEDQVRSAMCGIQNWFDSSMGHATGWYTRKVRVILLIIAFFMVAATNADSIQVAVKLAGDSQLRARVAALAATTAPVAGTAGEELKKLQAAAAEQLVKGDMMTGLAALPVGWQFCTGDGASFWQQLQITKCTLPVWWWLVWPVKFLGWGITAVAAALGAPFWFGLLQQLNAIRSAGPKPASTTAQ